MRQKHRCLNVEVRIEAEASIVECGKLNADWCEQQTNAEVRGQDKRGCINSGMRTSKYAMVGCGRWNVEAVSCTKCRGKSLQRRLYFWHKLSSIGLTHKIRLITGTRRGCPTAECCFSRVNLPVVHGSFEEVAQSMDEAVVGCGDRFLRE